MLLSFCLVNKDLKIIYIIFKTEDIIIMLNILYPIDKAKAVKIRTSAPPRPYLPIKALNIYTEYKAMNIISAAQKLLLN